MEGRGEFVVQYSRARLRSFGKFVDGLPFLTHWLRARYPTK